MENTDDPVLLTPTARILFDGLFFLRFDSTMNPTRECQIGVLTTARDHELTVTIIEALAEGKNVKYSRKKFTMCLATCRLLGHFSLKISNQPEHQRRVFRHGFGDGKPLENRFKSNIDPANFKWIFDFNNGEFNEKKLAVASGVFSPVLHVSSGVFYTYLVTGGRPYKAVKADEIERDFGHVAETVGLNIELKSEDEVFLEHHESGDKWKLPRHPNATYTIHFENLAPKCKTPIDDDIRAIKKLAEATSFVEFMETERKEAMEKERRDSVGTTPPSQDDQEPSDFRFYYDAFPSCSGLDKYDFLPMPLSAGKPIICYAAAGSGPETGELP